MTHLPSEAYLTTTFMHPSSSGPSSPKLQLQLSIPIPTRDPVYYISDGNTVLLVETTLFKVHRSTLTKDKSTFDSMFSLDSDLRSSSGQSSSSSVTAGAEGESDDNPIRLQGDTADEFRALLWALYALPHELTVALTPKANHLQLFNLSRITHKYQFRSIEAWALTALTNYYTRPSHSPSLDTSDEPSLVQLTELASLCEQRDLLEAATVRWKRQLACGKDVGLAIGVAERLNLRGLLGLAYHAMLLQGREHWDADPLLTRSQRVRLLSGHYALGRLWERLPNEPPTLAHSPRCTGGAQVRCNQAWAALWRSTLDMGKQVLPLQYADILGKIMLAESVVKALVEREIPTQGMLDAMPWCKDNALAATAGKVKEIQDTLADYFTDVL
ncbi:hypothetical protein SERLA73DRAFT_183611 [Serpula lacrymans var. lacrymans S7.3]|uniref:BTB domain-containing protein n=2 Tax=Serpula lacrymans var. lacrymans TaxID=341189 RepID=F8Q078_SERL3|nr:uncharacterized protein SERLADRAFT_470883 [Serpula lacrymans var. lacrymans S7.9]EGN98550.1 hypothetical protein SERLA73DRAFT_183611 [Serpula lacrymans var. lacrymans S7.3]EGO24118.1 hypothetical protein SERLADRAFT_470883 [Serpula lacrymans var. lacrymans S7.9]